MATSVHGTYRPTRHIAPNASLLAFMILLFGAGCLFQLSLCFTIPCPASPDKNIQQDVLVWHAGKDGNPITWEDNVFAWLAE